MATTSIIIFRAGLELPLTHLLGLLECSAFLGKGLSVRFAAHFIQCCLERIGGTRRRIWFGHLYLFTSSQCFQMVNHVFCLECRRMVYVFLFPFRKMEMFNLKLIVFIHKNRETKIMYILKTCNITCRFTIN